MSQIVLLECEFLLPIGPLMREHRLIERMVNIINDLEIKIKEQKEIDSNFIEVVVDFFRTYADKCHHGKEEDILFKRLAEKNLKNNHRKIMKELINGHAFARKTVAKLEQKNEKYRNGSKSTFNEIKELLNDLLIFYPKHIEKEDKHFFYPCMNYFSEFELDKMLNDFWEFDRAIIHEKYEKIVAEKEGKKIITKKISTNLPKWKCSVCGYIYDPEKGDPEHGIDPGISFEDLPEDWVCPVCSSPKTVFKKIELE